MPIASGYNFSYLEFSDGDEPWGGPAPTGISGGLYSCDAGKDGVSNSLRLYNYGFSLPDSVINGIIVNIYCSSIRIGDEMYVKLYDGTTLVGTEKIGIWDEDQVFGNSTDMWGTSLTYDKINLTNFGIRLYGIGQSNGTILTVVNSEIIVDYDTDPDPTGGGGGSGNIFLFNIF